METTLIENGIYHLKVCAAQGEESGVVMINDGTVNGGSGIYLYQGRLSLKRTTLSGAIEIRKWNQDAPAPLGQFKALTFTVKGQAVPEKRSFYFTGHFSGHHVVRIEATGVYLAPLAEL